MKRLKGDILWYSDRDQNGIIKGFDGKEYYFDLSVWKCPVSNPSPNRLVSFNLNTKITDCRCATDIKDYLAK